MFLGAGTPEELETLFEDAFMLGDQEALTQVFEPGALLVPGGGLREARGREEIAGVARQMWARQRVHVTDLRRVLQVRDTALIMGACAVSDDLLGDVSRTPGVVNVATSDHLRRSVQIGTWCTYGPAEPTRWRV